MIQSHEGSVYGSFVDMAARLIDECRGDISNSRLVAERWIGCHGHVQYTLADRIRVALEA